MLQEFDCQVKDRNRIENQVVDHLSKWEKEVVIKIGDWIQIKNTFPDEMVLVASCDLIPLFSDFANYFSSDLVLRIYESTKGNC